jgi:hypothetical protein
MNNREGYGIAFLQCLLHPVVVNLSELLLQHVSDR